jgi:putative transcriptional regulator
MDDQDFDGIVAGLGDAIAYARGDTTRGRVAAGPDVRAIRQRINLTQAQFARTYRIPLGTVRDWEQQRRQPDSGSATLLRMIQTDPKGVEEIIARSPS